MVGRVLCIAALVVQCCVNALAQEHPEAEHRQTIREFLENEAGDTGASAGERDLHQLVERIRVLRLIKAVDLSDEKLQALSQRLGRFKDQLAVAKGRRSANREELRDCLDRGLPEDQVKPKLEALLGGEKAIADIHHDMIREAGKDLTVAQTAKLYLFVGDFDDFIRDLILRAQHINHHGRSPDLGSSIDSASSSPEQSLVEELVRRQAGGPTGSDPEESDLAALFDGLLMAQLSRALDIDPEETIVLFRRVGTYKDQLKNLKWRVGASRAALRRALKQDTTDAELEQMLKDLLLQEEAVAEMISLLVTEAQKDVSLAKSARLYLFVGDFEDYMARLFKRVRRQRAATPSQP